MRQKMSVLPSPLKSGTIHALLNRELGLGFAAAISGEELLGEKFVPNVSKLLVVFNADIVGVEVLIAELESLYTDDTGSILFENSQ